ncbi:MAG: hypothetical protein J0M22_02125 [Gammaproteobacteria bacterium]|nr:hypothetical protein [Gammaproteobacteria bacterium]
MEKANQQEWLLVQRSFDQMEIQALWLKIVAIIVWLGLLVSKESLVLMVGVIGLFWLNEAIWKTQQQRAAARLRQLEQAADDISCQWHTDFANNRPGAMNLALGYLKNLLPPTVAVTYVIMLGATLVRHFF